MRKQLPYQRNAFFASVIAAAALCLYPSTGHLQNVTGDPASNPVNLFPASTAPASQVVSPIDTVLRIPSPPPTCASNEVLTMSRSSRSYTHADGSTQTSSIVHFSCSSSLPPPINIRVHEPTGQQDQQGNEQVDEVNWRTERDIVYDAFTGATAVVYRTYRDGQLVSSRNSFHNGTPTELMGNSADAIRAEEEGDHALQDYLDSFNADSSIDDGGNDHDSSTVTLDGDREETPPWER